MIFLHGSITPKWRGRNSNSVFQKVVFTCGHGLQSTSELRSGWWCSVAG
jgi:hypothetical protein